MTATSRRRTHPGDGSTDDPAPDTLSRDGVGPGGPVAAAGVVSPRLQVVWAAVWLVFLAYPVSDIVSGHHSRTWTMAAWAALAVFVALYLFVMWRAHGVDQRPTDRALAAWLGVFVVFTFAMVVGFDISAWGGAIIYTGVAAGSALRLRPALVTLVGIGVATAVVGAMTGVGLSNIAFDVFLTLGLGVTMLGIRRILAVVIELRQARDEVARLTAQEQRLRFSRDLHDVLGHNLSAIALNAQLARRSMPDDPDAARAALADVEAVTRRSLRELRELVAGYRERSLHEALTGASELLEAAGIQVSLDLPAVVVGGGADRLLAWAVREGVTNVVRHSGASHCAIRLSAHGDVVRLGIEDDGRGSAAKGPGADDGVGSGLRGLSERLAEVGGHLEVGPRTGGGFVLAANVPARA